jgi:hypothetical protein
MASRIAVRTIGAQREATAKEIYRDYLKLAFEHPAVAEGQKGASFKDARYQ